jgi:hypothetical protein
MLLSCEFKSLFRKFITLVHHILHPSGRPQFEGDDKIRNRYVPIQVVLLVFQDWVHPIRDKRVIDLSSICECVCWNIFTIGRPK